MAFLKSILDVIGGTPLVHLPRLSRELGAEVLAKLESVNPGGSVKDRVARAMVDEAEQSGALKPGGMLIEATSGNTGIALAMLAAARGYQLTLVMPEAMSCERVSLLKAYGAAVVLTPGTLMRQAVEQAEALGRSTPGAVLLRQFENPSNPAAHERTTAEEIWSDCEHQLDVFVSGIGTGGTITGVARALKPRLPELRIIGVEPAGAAVLQGDAAGAHHLQGIGAGFIPKVLDPSLIDQLISVTEEQALAAARRVARGDGVLSGISSGAALAATISLGKTELAGKRVVVMLPDAGERYVSTALFRALSE
ncbi:MAG: cysteine synthase A [Polyangiaceae bacterium]|nr:cysteine synthase A [Polyangiaceae bacterium]